jgi:ATP-dependent Lon protease
VMQESSKIANVVAKGFNPIVHDFCKMHDIHLHVPEGATPKDGPSAGVTMTTAMISLAMNKPVDPHLAMTGELSLSGMVLPVGGIKEKIIAARRSGCKTVVLPDGNRRDVHELPEYLKENLDIFFAKHYPEVHDMAFGEGEYTPEKRAERKKIEKIEAEKKEKEEKEKKEKETMEGKEGKDEKERKKNKKKGSEQDAADKKEEVKTAEVEG